jgi:dolichol-phosphate mannosyltransferase
VRLLLALTAVRTLAAALLPIVGEEAYHWNFARHPDIGYFDHPPMIAWSIACGRLLFGDTPLGVRAGPLAWSVGMFVVLARMAERFYGERAAVWAVGLLSLTPLAFIASAVGFPDAPLLFFWSLALSLSDRAIESRRGAWWLAAGAALGGGLLSKYTGVFLPFSILGYLLASRRDRFWLRSPWPYLGILVALGVFSPVLLWNGRHDWASFRFQSVERFADMGAPSLSTLRYFLLHQLLCVFPFTLPLAWVTCRRGLRGGDPRQQFLLWSCLPTLGFFLLVSLWRNTNYLWALPAYLGLVVAMAGTVISDQGRVGGFYRRHWRPLAVGVGGFAFAVALHARCILPFLPPIRELYGWENAARLARELRSTLPEGAFYLGLGRKYVGTSLLAFHLREPSAVHGRPLIGRRGLQYDLWDRPEDFEGRDAVVVLGDECRAGELLGEALPHFQTLVPVGRVVVGFGRHRIVEAPDMVFSVYRGRGYRPRELPPPESLPLDLHAPSAH